MTYTFDQADRLTRWVSGSTTAQYGYDGDGLRQSKTVGSTTTNQLWDVAEGMPLMVQDGSTRYITGPGGLPIEQVDGSSNVLYYYQDQLGSTRALLDGSGNTQATYTLDAYGNVTSKTGSASAPFQYAGQYTDSESGLQYLRARSFDPATAQFLTVDPLVAGTGEPYAYTSGNPLNATDPTGLCSWTDPLDCVVRASVGFLKTRSLPTQVAVAWGLNGLTDFIGISHRDLTSPNPAVKLLGVGYVYANVYLAFLPAAGALQNLVRGAESCGIGATDATDIGAWVVGRRGSPIRIDPGTNIPTEINGTQYTGHALDQMQGRGIPPSVVQNTIDVGTTSPGYDGATIY